MKTRMRAPGAIVVWALLSGTASAQNAQITGVAKDTSGAVVPGVTVTARNQATGFARTEVSDATGTYRLPSLPPGTYSLTAEVQGFSTETRPDIVLVIDQTATINFTLKLATVSETVTVTGESPIVDVTRSDVSTAVSTQQIQDLPVASRRWIDLAMLTPGTSQDNIRGQFYRGNVNLGAGTREYSNGFLVDGVNNTWAEMGEPRQNFAMDSIQEFKVSTSTYKAEYGLATGGVLTVVTKSGTNRLHGSGLLFFRDKAITGEEYFQKQNDVANNLPLGTSKPPYRRYQYGGTIGGPIAQDKTHYFFAVERTDEKVFQTVTTRGVWAQYDGIYPSKQFRWTYTGKVDHQLNKDQSLFVRVAQEMEYRPIVSAGGSIHPSNNFDFGKPVNSTVLGHTWVMNQRSINDFRFQYAFSKYEVDLPLTGAAFDAGDFSTTRLGACTPQFNYPSIRIGGCNSQMGPERRYQLKDDFSYLMPGWGGRHQWKLGFDYNYIPFEGDNTNNYAGTWTMPKDAQYDPTDRSTWPTRYTQNLPTYANIPTKTWAAYVQDDFEVTSGLTLNLGVRYDRQIGSFNEDVNGLLAKIGEKLGPQFAQFPVPVPFIDTSRRGDKNNFGPRVGLAWDPANNGRMNIHAGYGLFYDNIRTLRNFNELTWPQARQIVINNPAFPDPLQGRPRDSYLSTAPPNITVWSNDYVNPYAHQFAGGVTRQLTRDLGLTADVTYVRRYSDREDNDVDINIPDQITRVRPYPQFQQVSVGQPTQNNDYRALLLKLDKRMNNHVQALVSYTLSRSSDSSIRNNLADVYGYARVDSPAIADRRHRVVASGIVELPYAMQVSAILDLRSSLPFNPQTQLDLNNDTYPQDVPPGVQFRSGCRDLNVEALNRFRVSRGLAAVTDLACPGFANLDLRFSKYLPIGASRFELLAQLFNVTNRANFGTPVNNPTSPIFGQVNQILPFINAPSRQAEFAIRFQF
jgi:outer membrane receptor protein involved in Fe transport